jgi:hypothetical protein
MPDPCLSPSIVRTGNCRKPPSNKRSSRNSNQASRNESVTGIKSEFKISPEATACAFHGKHILCADGNPYGQNETPSVINVLPTFWKTIIIIWNFKPKTPRPNPRRCHTLTNQFENLTAATLAGTRPVILQPLQARHRYRQ